MEENISIGTLLKNAREQKKIKLEDVASKTKININILRSLEEDDLKNLPNMAYLRGFVKNYAKAVGVDAAQAQACLVRSLQSNETTTEKIIKKSHPPVDRQSPSSKDEMNYQEQELKENLVSILQSFFNKKLIEDPIAKRRKAFAPILHK